MLDLAELVPERGTWIGDFVAWADARMSAPTAFKLAVGIACVSSAIGRGAWLRLGPRRWTPHVWLLLLGPAGANKSTPVTVAQELVKAARGEDALLARRFTIEGIYAPLQACPDPLWDMGELKGLLGLLGRDYMAGGRNELTDLWDGMRMSRTTVKTGQVAIDRPAVTAVAGARVSDFEESAGLQDFSSGLLSRFIVFQASDAGPYVGMDAADGYSEDVTDVLERQLKENLFQISAWHGGDHQIHFDADAKALFHHHDQQWRIERDKAPRELSGWAARKGIQTLKLAALHGLSRLYKPQADAEDVYWAIQVVEAAWRAAETLASEEVGLDRDAPRRQRVRQAADQIARQNAGIVRFRDLARRVQRLVKDHRELRGITSLWTAGGEYERGFVPTGGRKAEALLAEKTPWPDGWQPEDRSGD